MNKFLKMAAFGAAVCMSFAFGTSANATTLVDIVDYIDDTDGGGPDTGVGEQNWGAGTRTINTLTMNAAGYNIVGGVFVAGEHAYLDGGGAGMGVCQVLNGTQCDPPSDDNVTGNNPTEALAISFLEKITIEELYFRNDGHNSNFFAGRMIDVYIDSVLYGTYTLATAADGTDIGAVLVGWTDVVLAANTELRFGYNNQQFYLAGFDFTLGGGEITVPVPLPAGLMLLLSGLLGLGFLGRFRAKTA